MGCLPAWKKNYYKSRITYYKSLLVKIDAAMLDAMENGGVSSYRFDSGEGVQQTKYRTTEELQKMFNLVESKLAWYYNRLKGQGVIYMNLRRKPYNRNNRRY